MAQEDLREIRMRSGCTALYRLREGDVHGRTPLLHDDLLRAAQALTGHGLSVYASQLSQGFVPVPGGHRLGVCGRMYTENGQLRLCEISSLCLRMAHSVPHAADSIWPRIRGQSLLILGPPGSGKTTLLREIIRLHTLDGMQVCVADERGEIAACAGGMPQLDIGCADVITHLPKARALPLLLRSMAPDYLCTDELGSQEEVQALLHAHASGVRVLCTAHGRSPERIRHTPDWEALFQHHVFDAFIVLRKPDLPLQYIASGEIMPCTSCYP